MCRWARFISTETERKLFLGGSQLRFLVLRGRKVAISLPHTSGGRDFWQLSFPCRDLVMFLGKKKRKLSGHCSSLCSLRGRVGSVGFFLEGVSCLSPSNSVGPPHPALSFLNVLTYNMKSLIPKVTGEENSGKQGWRPSGDFKRFVEKWNYAANLVWCKRVEIHGCFFNFFMMRTF